MEKKENSKQFRINLYVIPYTNKVAKMIQGRILIGVAKGLHQAHGYKWKEVPKENKQEQNYTITITGSEQECLEYKHKLEQFGLNKVNDIMKNDENAIKRILPAKLRAKLKKGIQYKDQNNAMQKIQNRLQSVGIVLDYGIFTDVSCDE